MPKRDLASAHAALEAAGMGRVSVQLSIPNSSDYRQDGEAIQSMAAEAGNDIQLSTLKTASLVQQWTAGDLRPC